MIKVHNEPQGLGVNGELIKSKIMCPLVTSPWSSVPETINVITTSLGMQLQFLRP